MQMSPGQLGQAERTLRMAASFLDEIRTEVERAAREANDLVPRLRLVHERRGQATPELRTLALPPLRGNRSFVETISSAVAAYAARRKPDRLMLALEVYRSPSEPALVIEAVDRAGTRLFWMQCYQVEDGRVRWQTSDEGWSDPGAEEMILDAAIRVAAPSA